MLVKEEVQRRWRIPTEHLFISHSHITLKND